MFEESLLLGGGSGTLEVFSLALARGEGCGEGGLHTSGVVGGEISIGGMCSKIGGDCGEAGAGEAGAGEAGEEADSEGTELVGRGSDGGLGGEAGAGEAGAEKVGTGLDLEDSSGGAGRSGGTESLGTLEPSEPFEPSVEEIAGAGLESGVGLLSLSVEGASECAVSVSVSEDFVGGSGVELFVVFSDLESGAFELGTWDCSSEEEDSVVVESGSGIELELLRMLHEGLVWGDCNLEGVDSLDFVEEGGGTPLSEVGFESLGEGGFELGEFFLGFFFLDFFLSSGSLMSTSSF